MNAETPESPRTRRARDAAELALVRVVHHYGETPQFVLIGGLVPDLLCSNSDRRHAGTTDIDVQVDLEIAPGSVHTARLEQALRNSEFAPGGEHSWRWKLEQGETRTEVKFELLADQDDVEASATIQFADCQDLGAVNLRGTGVASQDIERQTLRAVDGGVHREVKLRVTGLAGYLLAKTRAWRERRKDKDLYDMAFVVLHNDKGGSRGAAQRVVDRFSGNLGSHVTPLRELAAAFADPQAAGPQAYVEQLLTDHPEANARESAADAAIATTRFCEPVLSKA